MPGTRLLTQYKNQYICNMDDEKEQYSLREMLRQNRETSRLENESLKNIVLEKFAQGDKRFDAQDASISDIKDQIKGNPDRGVQGLRTALKEMKEQNETDGKKLQKQIDEHNKVLVLPILINKLPKGLLITILVIMAEGVLEMAHKGIITTIFFPR